MDVDKIERDAAAERAAEAKSKAAEAPMRQPCAPPPRHQVILAQDHRWLAAAAALAGRGRWPGPTRVARCWCATAGAGARLHAAWRAPPCRSGGAGGRGCARRHAYVTLEPCAHVSARGPACADLVAASAARVVVGCADPDPRTAGEGMARLRAAGIAVDLADSPACRASLEGYLACATLGRPHVTLKLALSLDGCIALAGGESQWITGPQARPHPWCCAASATRFWWAAARCAPMRRGWMCACRLEAQSPQRLVLTHGAAPAGWTALRSPEAIAICPACCICWWKAAPGRRPSCAGLVDRLLIYRAPILIGAGRPALGDIGLTRLADAHHRWRHADHRRLGNDTLDVYESTPCSQA
jgi:diaminohydroxyphosphoribosylaminopyrimidine deaminase/5-amino-6-(5-phosphoribosylamino)uracil reductase